VMGVIIQVKYEIEELTLVNSWHPAAAFWLCRSVTRTSMSH
jgi:hypothetical protein